LARDVVVRFRHRGLSRSSGVSVTGEQGLEQIAIVSKKYTTIEYI